ncbi:MAG: hypothetical protein HYX65_05455 [Gemmatimonadetes bacterium]|nr:hypothetical protein [Gemmatimonadota bacterium]
MAWRLWLRSSDTGGLPLETLMAFGAHPSVERLPLGGRLLKPHQMQVTDALDTFLARCGEVRMKYFAANGFPPCRFGALHVGMVVRRDDIEYARGFRLRDAFDAAMACVGMSAVGSRWTLRNRFVSAGWRRPR